MATPFSRLVAFEDLEKELQYFGKRNFSALQKYAVSTLATPINDDKPIENKKHQLDIPRALSVQPTVEAYERSNFLRRWWLWASTDISNMRNAYYYARATVIFNTLNKQQPLSSPDHQFITHGIRQHSSFSSLGSIYRALNNKTQLSPAIRQTQGKLNISLANSILPKPITLFGSLLKWLGFNQEKATIEFANDEITKNPSVSKHAKFKKQFEEYKQSVKELISKLEESVLGKHASLNNAELLRAQLNDLKKKERSLMLMTHPDKNPGDYEAIAKANFQRIQLFIDWKTNYIEKTIADIESTKSLGREITVSIMLLQPSFNELNALDEMYGKEIEQNLSDKQRIDEISARIKKQYEPVWHELQIKKEAARKASQEFDDSMRKLDAENAELRKNVQLRKIAASLQTSTKQEAAVANTNNDATRSPTQSLSASPIDDSITRPYFKTNNSISDGPTPAQDNHTPADVPTPIN